MMLEDLKHLWLENLLDMEKIINLMESCDKECNKCTREQKNDCILEMRESIHSLAIHFKNAIYSFVRSEEFYKLRDNIIIDPSFGD